MLGFPLELFVVVSVALLILALWWKPPSSVERQVSVVLMCCMGALLAGWFLGLAVLALLNSFAIVPNIVQALSAALMIAALSRISFKASKRAGLATVLSIATLAGLLPVWVFGL